MDRCVEQPNGPPPDARAVVRSFGTEQVRSPFDRSSGRLASKACGRAVARGKRAIGSAMRVVKVRDRRGPEREPAPALDAADAAGARVGKLREVEATGLYRGSIPGSGPAAEHDDRSTDHQSQCIMRTILRTKFDRKRWPLVSASAVKALDSQWCRDRHRPRCVRQEFKRPCRRNDRSRPRRNAPRQAARHTTPRLHRAGQPSCSAPRRSEFR